MDKLKSRIEKLKNLLDFLKDEGFSPAHSGTRYKVFVSEKYVIRFRDDDPGLLKRETKFLEQLSHPFIPKIVWEGVIDDYPAMIENRLPGKTLDTTWLNLPPETQNRIVQDIIEFIGYLRGRESNKIYSVNTGRKYNHFFDYFTDGIEEKIDAIKRYTQAEKKLRDLLTIIKNPETKGEFKKIKITLVHGDLIIHNLLTDGKRLTGILDWEFALWGDPDYDLARLWYYRERAKAYEEQGIDEIYESDFMDKLASAIKSSNLVEDEEIFEKKYKIIQAYYMLNALYWAVKSENPQKNIEELIK